MFQYPIVKIQKQEWQKKVQATLMFSIPAEDEALPVLYEILDIVQHLNSENIDSVLGQQVREYFMNFVLPQVCSKIIKSRYFKNQIVLQISNKILGNCLYLYPKYLQFIDKYNGLNQILGTVFTSDEYYFKTNNQLNYKLYPHYYYDNLSNIEFTNTLKENDLVDVIKSNGKYDKLVWSRGKVIIVNQSYLEIQYLNDVNEKTITIDKNSFEIAPYQSKSKDFQWRMSLKQGDILDCQDSFGSWYHGTILKVINHDNDSKSVHITFKVYDQNGNKSDQNGKFYGFKQQQQTFDVTVPRIMPFCSTCKYRNYQVAKSSFQTDDSNDMVFEEIGSEIIYALPRKRALSEFYFRQLNAFGKMGGFDKPIKKLQNQINFQFLCSYVKSIGNVCPYLHKKIVIELVESLKSIVQKHIFSQSEIVAKEFTKQRSEALFTGLKTLMKRLHSPQEVQQYENDLKMKLVSKCLESQALKRKLQGLHELKDIVRGISHLSQRTKTVKNWVIEEKIFDKIYLQNSHVQLIKKSQDFFKFLINQDILQVKDLERLYKIAQKGDYESRVSLYKLFQQMSHVFNKSHVDFLIDTILESDLNLVLNEDIDMLHQLSRFSNYFPKQKVKDFFEKLILNDTKNKELNEYATKKYSQIVARGYQMKAYRREIIKNFVSKLNTNHYEKVIKVLKGIFQGINVGQWGKKDLCEILQEQNIQEIIVKAIKQNRQKADYKKMVHQMLNFQLFIVKLSIRIKIKLENLRSIWQQLSNQNQFRFDYYQWLNQIMDCDQGIQVSDNDEDLVNFYKELFSQVNLSNLTKQEFVLAKNMFVQINKKAKLITVSNVIRQKQVTKQYQRRMDMKSLKLLQQIQKIIFQCQCKQISQKAFYFYLQLYSSKQNSKQEISELLNSLIEKFKTVYESKEIQKIQRTLNMIEMVVNDSQKFQQFEIVSMIKCRKASLINVTIINDISYMSDSIRKQNLFEKRNISLRQLKTKIAAKVNLPLEQLKIVGKTQLSDYYNSYTLAELNIDSDEPLTVTRQLISSIPEEDLIIDGKLNQKAIRAFRVIFDKYSSRQNQMSKQDYNKFTAMCLGTYSKNYYDKIQPIYNKYDSDQDGYLSFQDFITFYTDAALDKPQTVWSNLKNLNVKGNFKFKDQPEEQMPQQQLPRYKLYNNQQFYDILFNLLEEKSISKTVYNFLLRLPANKNMHQEIRNIWNDSSDEDSKQKLKKFFTQKSQFRFMYKLILILNILQFTEINNSIWNVKFAMKKGYEIPFEFLKNIVENKQTYTGIQLDIIELIFEIIKDYIYNGFGSKESLESSSLFQEDCTMDEKMQCLLTGVYPKTYSSSRRDYMTAFKYEWVESKEVFISLFMKLLIKMKKEIIDQKQTQNKTVLSSMIFKIMSVLSCLLVNQQQKDLLPIYSLFFDVRQNPKELKQFYMLILCICFYSLPHQQHLHISELFKYIKSKHITSEHFIVLALLVSKFGFKEQNVSQIPEVLLQNILQEDNQPTIEGCAKLLCNFQVSQLKSISPEDVQKIFDKCLFGQNVTCKKEQARNQIYELLIKISQVNKQIAEKVVEKTRNVIEQNMPLMKVTYSSEVNKRNSYGYAGLKNLGNICYMNSMLQQLFMNKTFRYLILRADDQLEPQWSFDAKGQKVDDNLLHQIQRIFAYLEHTSRQDFSPSAFCIAYKPFGESVNIMMQQDVQQFVSMFFDRLEEGIKEHPLRNLIQNFYTGKTANIFKCHNCKKAKKIEENFHSISLQVKNSKNLSESFNRYALGEVINDYKCDFCEQKVDVSKMTRISKPPQVLIIHLQRIVFNLDTFVNEKITTKHQFPIELNIYPYSLQHFERQQSSQQNLQDLSDYDYELTGIIVHIGNAESGHYISFIKTEQNKWLQFNDSLISLFSVNSIEAQCFGGMSSAFQDDFDWQKKQNSKSAYLLIYNRKLDPKIQLILREKQLARKQQILQELRVQEESIKNQEDASNSKISQPTESHQETGSAFQDSQKEREKQKILQEETLKQIEMIKQKKSEDNINSKTEEITQKSSNDDKVEIKIKNKITPYMSPSLKEEIQIDNRVHFFESSLASQGFSTFFAKLISIPHLHSEDLIRMCQKLTFTFWLKSKSFKQLLNALSVYLKTNPSSVYELVLKNDQIFSMLIQNSNIDIRVNVAHFLASAIQSYALSINGGEQFVTQQSYEGKHIYEFLDKMFNLIPTTVTKCWTKFNQYFEFWYLISDKKIFAKYMVEREILKHFADYFLDKKSPLKIYATKKVQQIGSSYANPDFSMLLRCVSRVLNHYFVQENNFKVTEQDQKVLVHFEFIQKLISEDYQQIAAKLAKQICPQNLKASQKFAVVLLKGFSKSTYENIQKYIDVLKQFVSIEDEFQLTRMQWVLGKQTLNVSVITKTLSALNSKNFEERLYLYESSLHVEQGASFLQPIYQLNKRVENFCILCVKAVLQLCLNSKSVREYILRLRAPSLIYARYLDFYEEFINRYIDESKRSYYSTVTSFNKAELGLQVKKMFDKLMQIKKQFIEQEQEQNQIEQIKLQSKDQQIENQQQEEKQNDTENIQEPQIMKDNYVLQNIQVPQILNKGSNSQDFAKIQFLDGSFSKDKKVDQNENVHAVEVIKNDVHPQQQQSTQNQNNQSQQINNGISAPKNGQLSNFEEWQEVNFSDQQNKKTKNQQSEKQVQPQIYQQLSNDKKVHEDYGNYEVWQQDNYLNPYLIEPIPYEVDSNKNNSRKSQIQHNDSREEDFNGIEMKQFSSNKNKQTINQTQETHQGQYPDQNVQYQSDQQENQQLLQSLQLNDKKSSNWSNPQDQTENIQIIPAHAGARPSNRPSNLEQLKIQSKNKLADEENQADLENSDGDQNEPFIKQNKKTQKVQVKETYEETYKMARHPVEFIYQPGDSLQLPNQLFGVQVIYHESKLISIKTQPTGTSNLSFTKVEGSRKLYNRIKQECWETRKQQIVKGYYLTNHSRIYVRVQTPTGCHMVKPNQSSWIWSDSILKIWKCERSSDWPDWSIYE